MGFLGYENVVRMKWVLVMCGVEWNDLVGVVCWVCCL